MEHKTVSDLEHFSFSHKACETLSGRPFSNYILLNIFGLKHDVTLKFHTNKYFDMENLNMASDLLK